MACDTLAHIITIQTHISKGHLRIPIVKQGVVDGVELHPGRPFIYQIGKGKDPLKTIFPDADCREYLTSAINNFKFSFAQKALVKGSQTLAPCAELTSAMKQLGSMMVDHNSKKYPDIVFADISATDPVYAKDFNMAITGFKMNELSVGVHHTHALAMITMQLQGVRMIVIANPYTVAKVYQETVKNLQDAIDWLKSATPDSAPPLELDTFVMAVGVLHPGDSLIAPMGSIVIEKALNADSIALRLPLPTYGTPEVSRAFKLIIRDTQATPLMMHVEAKFALPEDSADDAADTDDDGSSSSSSSAEEVAKESQDALAPAPKRQRSGTATPIAAAAAAAAADSSASWGSLADGEADPFDLGARCGDKRAGVPGAVQVEAVAPSDDVEIAATPSVEDALADGAAKPREEAANTIGTDAPAEAEGAAAPSAEDAAKPSDEGAAKPSNDEDAATQCEADALADGADGAAKPSAEDRARLRG
jgi:hypothetical protein